jgi:WD40 repeat protein
MSSFAIEELANPEHSHGFGEKNKNPPLLSKNVDVQDTEKGIYDLLVHQDCKVFSKYDGVYVINKNDNKFPLKNSHGKGCAKLYSGPGTLVGVYYDGWSYIIKIWATPKRGKWIYKTTIKSHTSEITSIVFAQNTLICASREKTCVWNINTGQLQCIIDEKFSSKKLLVIKGKLISCDTKCIKIFSLGTWAGWVTCELLKEIKFTTPNDWYLSQIDRFGKNHFLVMLNNELQMYTVDGEHVRTFKGHEGICGRFLVVPNRSVKGNFPCSQLIITSAHNDTIKLWNPETGDCLNAFGKNDCTRALMMYRGNLITSSSYCGITIWDLETGKLIHKYHYCHTKVIVNLVPYKKGFLTLSHDDTILEWYSPK